MKKREIIIFIVIWAALYIPAINLTPVGFLSDDSVYVLASKSIIHGKYSLFDNKQLNYTIPYPPGFPLLLAPVSFFAPSDYNYYKIPALLFSLGAVFLFYFLSRNFFVSILLLLQPFMVYFAQTAMSEMPFLFFSLLILNYSKKEFVNSRQILPLILLSFFAFLIRPIGIVIFPSAAIFLLLKKRYRQTAVFLLLGGILIIIYFILKSKYDSSNTGLFSHFSNPDFIFLNILYHAQGLTELFFFPGIQLKPGYFSLLIYIPVFWGWFLMLKKNNFSLPEIFFAVYMSAVFFWKSPDIRFFFPVIPFILTYYVEFFNSMPGSRAIKFIPVFASAALFIYWDINSAYFHSKFKSDAAFPISSYKAAKQLIPENETTLADATFYLYTGKECSFTPATLYIYPDSFFLYFISNHINYFFISTALEKSPIWGGFANPNIQESNIIKAVTKSARYELLYENPAEKVRIYRINEEKAGRFLRSHKILQEVFGIVESRKNRIPAPEARKIENRLKEAVRLDPELMEARNILAHLYLFTNRDNPALREIMESIKIDPDYPYLYATLGMIYEKQKDIETAGRQYLIAMEKAEIYGDEGLIKELKFHVKKYP